MRASPLLSSLAVAVIALALASGGCARSATVAAAAPVRLSVPPPPPRVISMPPEPVAPVETTTVDQPVERRATRPSRPAARPDAGARAGQTTPEPEPAAEAAAPEQPALEPSTPTGPVLRTPQTADESQAANRVRQVLKRALTLLGQVNATGLAPEARTQHETARRFISQAEQALIERNFVFASYLADKAETLARGVSR